MHRVLMLLLSGVIICSCTGSPTEPGNMYKGFSAATDSVSYYANSPVTVTIRNESGSTGLFSTCGGHWDFTLQKTTGGTWTAVDGLTCLAIYRWTVAPLRPDSSHSFDFSANALFDSQHSSGTYRFRFRFGVLPDSTLPDSLFSNTFVVK